MLDTTQAEVAFALRMVRQAAHLAQRIQAEMVVEGMAKQDRSPVTVADFAAQAVVGAALEESFPDEVLVGEENAGELASAEGAVMLAQVQRFVASLVAEATAERVCAWIDRGASAPTECFWTLDPVDGTKGYLRGGHYAVALARIERGEVTLGALGCPVLGDPCRPDVPGAGVLLIAQRGEGTWLAPLAEGEAFRPLRVSDCREAAQARILRSFESGHTNTAQIDQIAARLGVKAEPVRMDSQAKYVTLAAGGAELLFRLLSPRQPDYKEKIWDQAAGSIVLEEAGGRITDLRGEALDFAQGRTLAKNTGVFASNRCLHEAGLEAIAAVCG